MAEFPVCLIGTDGRETERHQWRNVNVNPFTLELIGDDVVIPAPARGGRWTHYRIFDGYGRPWITLRLRPDRAPVVLESSLPRGWRRLLLGRGAGDRPGLHTVTITGIRISLVGDRINEPKGSI